MMVTDEYVYVRLNHTEDGFLFSVKSGRWHRPKQADTAPNRRERQSAAHN